MSQKLPVNGFKWVKNLMKTQCRLYKKHDKDIDIFLDVEYPKTLFNSYEDLPFLPERNKVEKVEKLICRLEDKEKYVIRVRALKPVLNHGLKLKKVHRVIQFNQEACLKPYIHMNTELKTKFCFWKNIGKSKKSQRY